MSPKLPTVLALGLTLGFGLACGGLDLQDSDIEYEWNAEFGDFDEFGDADEHGDADDEGSNEGSNEASAASGGGNKAACMRYVEHYNKLPCLGGSFNLDAEATCGMVDATPVDMTGYYDCLVTNSTCDGAMPKIEITGCSF